MLAESEVQMSEYQYYEFRSIDRPLSARQMEELRKISSRAQITPSSFVNVYNYGDFRGDPDKLIDKYFDAFLYLANWGTRWLMLRVPRKLLSSETAAAFGGGDCLAIRQRGDHVVLSFRSEDEEDYEWAEGEGWIGSLLPLRSSLMRGDHRALYLGWLLAVQNEELDEDAVEPAVPPGLDELDSALDQLARFLRIDTDLIAAAAERSAAKPSSSLTRHDVIAWLSDLSAKKKDDLLTRLITDEDPHLVVEIQQQALESVHGTSPPSDERRRTAADLLERAQVLGDARRAMEAKDRARKKAKREREAAKRRQVHLSSLRGKEPKLWSQVHELIDTRQPKRYDAAVELLRDLHDLAKLREDLGAFRTKMSALHDQHQRKTTLVERFRKARLLGG